MQTPSATLCVMIDHHAWTIKDVDHVQGNPVLELVGGLCLTHTRSLCQHACDGNQGQRRLPKHGAIRQHRLQHYQLQ